MCSFFGAGAMSFVIIIVIVITLFFGGGGRRDTWTTFFMENKLNFWCKNKILISFDVLKTSMSYMRSNYLARPGRKFQQPHIHFSPCNL